MIFLGGELAAAGRFLQNSILIFCLPEIPTLLTDHVVDVCMLLEGFQLSLQGQ